MLEGSPPTTKQDRNNAEACLPLPQRQQQQKILNTRKKTLITLQ